MIKHAENVSKKYSKIEGSAEYFDKKAKDYFSWYDADSPGGYALRIRKQKALKLIDRKQGIVLDVGCGPGVLVSDILNLGCEFWGIDASPNMINECRRNFGDKHQAHFILGNFLYLPFSDECFDVVICLGVIDRIPSYKSALKEMARVVKANGIIIIAFPNLLSPYSSWKAFVFYPIVFRLKALYHFFMRRAQHESLLPSFNKLHTVRSATKLMEKETLEIINIAHYNFNVFLSPIDEIFPRWSLKMTKKIELLNLQKLRWLGSGFLVKAIKHT